MSPFNRAAWDGEQPLAMVGKTEPVAIKPGVYVLTKDALAAADAGGDNAHFWPGCGLVYGMRDWQDQSTGEVDDVLKTVNAQHGRLNFSTIVAAAVGSATPLGTNDAAQLLRLCGKELTKGGGKTSTRIFDVIAVVRDVLHGPAWRASFPSLLDDRGVAHTQHQDAQFPATSAPVAMLASRLQALEGVDGQAVKEIRRTARTGGLPYLDEHLTELSLEATLAYDVLITKWERHQSIRTKAAS